MGYGGQFLVTALFVYPLAAEWVDSGCLETGTSGDRIRDLQHNRHKPAACLIRLIYQNEVLLPF